MKTKFQGGVFCLVFGLVCFRAQLSVVFIAIPLSYGFPVDGFRPEFPGLFVKSVFIRHALRVMHLLTKLNEASER